MEIDPIQLAETVSTGAIALLLAKYLFNHANHLQETMNEIKTLLVTHLKNDDKEE